MCRAEGYTWLTSWYHRERFSLSEFTLVGCCECQWGGGNDWTFTCVCTCMFAYVLVHVYIYSLHTLVFHVCVLSVSMGSF